MFFDDADVEFAFFRSLTARLNVSLLTDRSLRIRVYYLFAIRYLNSLNRRNSDRFVKSIRYLSGSTIDRLNKISILLHRFESSTPQIRFFLSDICIAVCRRNRNIFSYRDFYYHIYISFILITHYTCLL